MVQAISGLGGIGKTDLAKEFADRNRDSYNFIAWFLADSASNLLGGMRSFAQDLQLVARDPSVTDDMVQRRIRQWMADNDNFLFIFDNADDPRVVKDFLPDVKTGRRHVLLTTRASATGDIATAIEIKQLPPEYGAYLLLKRAKKISSDATIDTAKDSPDWNVAVEISKEMDGLPLALDQAGAFIEETGRTTGWYLDHFRSQKGIFLKKRGNSSSEHPASVWVTFTDAFQKVKEKSQAAADLVTMCAFLAPDDIPDEIFLSFMNEVDFTEAYCVACRFSLIHRNNNETFSIHRLAQAVLQEAMEPSERVERGERVIDAVATAFPDAEYVNWEICERLLPHALTLANDHSQKREPFALLLMRTGYFLHTRYGRYVEAKPLYERALTVREWIFGLEHEATLVSVNNLAELYRSLRWFAKAEPLCKRALEGRERVLGAEHEHTLASINNLGLLYLDQERYVEAEQLLTRALTVSERELGADHHVTLTSVTNLAALYFQQGRYSEAESLMKRWLAVSERVLGTEHQVTLKIVNNLAVLYDNQGRDAEAEPLNIRAVSDSSKVFGNSHPITEIAITNYTDFLRKLGRHAEADALEASLASSDDNSTESQS